MQRFEAEAKAQGVIVIIHGAMEHHGRYRWLIEKWRQKNYHVITGDLVGLGQTSDPRGHIKSFHQYLSQVRGWLYEALKYELPVFLLGHSMGGLIAILLLEEGKYQIAGAVLSSPCLGLLHKPSKLLEGASHFINLFNPQMMQDSGIRPEIATRNFEVLKQDQDDDLYVKEVSVRWYRELVKAMNQAIHNADKFQDVPMLVMQAGADLIVDKEAVRNWFGLCPSSDKHYKEWHGLYHEIFNEPEREDIFTYARKFVELVLSNLGYHIE